MRKKILFLLFLLLFINTKVYALTYNGCEYSSIARLKSIVSNINLSYIYHINDYFAYFDVTINNLAPNIYFVDVSNQKKYYYSDTNNGEITIKNLTYDGSFKFYSTLNDCNDTLLGTKYYKFPVYNLYYNNELCSDIPEYSLCQKWVKINYSYDKFESLIYQYKDNLNKKGEVTTENITYKENWLNNLVDLYIKYYYYFFAVIIIIFGGVILINKKRDKFNFK